jgi:hypothetical protein
MRDFVTDAGEVVRRSSQPLVVGAAHDPAEHEADAVAAEVVQRLAEQEAGQKAGDAPAHVHPVPAGRVHRSAHGAHEEFETSPDVDQRIRRATGSGGRPLDADVRRRFEGATGRDLGNVRVHHGDEADQLNRAVSAKAFTTGNDIFFSKGSYRPDSRAGQHLLAHELAHTAQQGGAVQRTIRRFALDNADFTKTESVNVFQKGGSGNVALFDDGSGNPLVVKVNQLIGNEVAVAGQLHDATAAENGASGGFRVTTPGTRLARPEERSILKQVTLAKLDPTHSPRNFVKGLDVTDKPVIIMERSGGVDFSEALETTQHTKKGRFGKTVANEDSILFKLTKDPGPLTALAKQLPVDVVMGMFDRLIGYYNADNFMYDEATQSFGYVDNTQNGMPGFLTSVDIGGIFTNKESFDSWAANGFVKNLIGNPAALAKSMFDTTIGEKNGPTGIRNQLPKSQPDVGALFESALKKNGAKMQGWIQAGIVKGRSTLINQLQNPLPLVSGLPDEQKREALQSLLAKNLVLKGAAPDKAWTAAGVHADRLLMKAADTAPSTSSAPQRPDSKAPEKDGGTKKGSSWKPGVRWKSATPAQI